MSKRKMRVPNYCRYEDFIDAFHEDFRTPLPILLQRSRRGTFPKYKRLDGQKSPALFERQAIVDYVESNYADVFPEMLDDVAAMVGVPLRRGQRCQQ
ncbi:hypothetical protein AYO42_00780 [Rhizomicrobium sp. SCGC AG-212-E05]|nr:hypothetical protein AYO42_00780 [Rhizomicrobium sp. SCGC AG-212-E05]